MLACMKGFSSLGAIIILIVGLASAAMTFYGFSQSQIFLDDTASRNMILGIMLAFSILVIFCALLGICGLRKKKPLFICIFQLAVVAFCVAFLIIGAVANVFPDTFFQGDCSQSDNQVIKEAYQLYTVSQLTFCQKGCPCGLTDKVIAEKYTQAQRLILQNLNRTQNGPLSTQACASASEMTDKMRALSMTMGGVEQLFKCSGWCPKVSSTNLIYRFSNVNAGKPEGYCYDIIKDEAEHYGGIIALAAFGVSAFLLLVAIVNFCICCHPERRKLSMKDRFVVMNSDGSYQAV